MAVVKTLELFVYGDTNLNQLDGSSVWLQSIVDVLASVPDVYVTLLLKAEVKTERLIAPLMCRENISIVDAFENRLLPRLSSRLDSRQVGSILAQLEARQPFDALFIRGYEVAAYLARLDTFRGRMWTFLIGMPQSIDAITMKDQRDLSKIIAASYALPCQTEDLRSYVEHLFPECSNRTLYWPPILPEFVVPTRPSPREKESVLRLVYSGKMSIDWCAEEMIRMPRRLSTEYGLDVELHVVGDKIHREIKDTSFHTRVRAALDSPSIVWHGGVPRAAAMEVSSQCDIGLCWRSPALDASLELSTKFLEYGALGLPVVLNRTPVYVELLGPDYPLFADSEDFCAQCHCPSGK